VSGALIPILMVSGSLALQAKNNRPTIKHETIATVNIFSLITAPFFFVTVTIFFSFMKQYIDGFVKSRIFPFSGFPPSREGQKGNKNKIDTIGVIPAKAGIQVVLWLFMIFSIY
jgi:hypothetical protein